MFRSASGQPLTPGEQRKLAKKAGYASARSKWGYKAITTEAELVAWFWSKADKRGPDDCWPWIPCKGKDCYGQFFDSYHRVRTSPHRFSLELKLGRPLKSGLFALHTCDSKSCANPAHLWEGTSDDNSKDMVGKGRQSKGAKHARIIRVYGARGEMNGNSKISDADALRIRRLHATGRYSQRKLARMFHVSKTAIGYTLRDRKFP